MSYRSRPRLYLYALVLVECFAASICFSTIPQYRRILKHIIEVKCRESTSLRMIDFIGGGSGQSGQSGSQTKITDQNDAEFEVGNIIQTRKELKAYHVGNKGYGRFGDDGTFEPLDLEKTELLSRSDKCLVIPIGFRGVVTRVYNTEHYDASQPIVAKFFAGDRKGGKFAPPLDMTMHFVTNEVEVVL